MSSDEKRLLALKTPLGAGVLMLTAVHGREELSRLFSFDLEMYSLENHAVTADQIVGKSMTFGIGQQDGSLRSFNGIVSQFYAGDESDGARSYRARVVPWLWFLTRKSDCRIFQKKTVPDIVERIFTDLGFQDFDKSQILGNHPTREYCVQYRETSYNFISRLLEEEGIFYFFRHEDGKHTLVLADSPAAYVDCREKEIDYPFDVGSEARDDHLTSWEHRYEFRSGKWAQTDYNFETPSTSLFSTADTVVSLADAKKYELYDYPGIFGNKGDGKSLTDLRMEEEEIEYDVVHASSICRSLMPGGKFKVKQHRCDSEKKQYLVTAVEHSARELQPGETRRDDGYHNSFTCVPAGAKFRPARITPRPVVHGVQTALVVGPGGEEIYCDKYGRVKVQFYWDREGKKNEDSSCYVRVASSLAGKKWGFVAIPRIGQEVVVDFLEGDPDRPLIVGSVYNAEQMPHYDPSQESGKTKTYLKTNSTKGGSGFNELMFDDKAGDERVFVHAQKDMDVRVRNDSKEHVLGNHHEIIGGSRRTLIQKDRHVHVQGAHTEQIEGDMQLYVGGGDGGHLDLVVEKDRCATVKGGDSLHVQGNRNARVDGGWYLDTGTEQQNRVGTNYAVDAGQAIHIKAGMTLVLEAGMQLSLKVGGNFIDIGPAGVSIQGSMVMINSGGAAGSGAGCNVQSPNDARQASPADPADAHDAKSGMKSAS